ncbi:MAG: hypothetical protein CL911_07715 [Deltaproteobacteria bacterium]|nr:hypothetical protein [Deltaproteobacteria bacterium]
MDSQIVVRVAPALIKNIDELAEHLEAIPEYAPTGRCTRSDAVRLLLLRGLQAMERELEEKGQEMP